MKETKHDIWKDKEGLTTLCFSSNPNNTDAQIIHSFYATSHYEAMTIYYEFMNWGIYETDFEIDKEPYKQG